MLAAAQRPLNTDPNDPRVDSDKWRDQFYGRDLEVFLAEAGPLLQELGYNNSEPTTSTGGGAASNLRPARATLRRVRRRLGDAKATSRAENGGSPFAESTRLGDAMLDALQTGNVEMVQDLLLDDVHLRVLDGEEEQHVSGRTDVAKTLVADAAWGGRQVRGDSYPGVRASTLVLVYEQSDARTWRILAFTSREGKIGALSIYRLGV